jgi:Ca2+-binding RTX toxin-like protein
MSDPSVNPADPNAPGINLYGADDSDTFNLGSGRDVVYLGGANETVIGGTGTDWVWETSADQGATVSGGSGLTELELYGGGTFALGANVSNVPIVKLNASTNAYDVTGDAQSGETLDDLSAGADTLRAGVAGQTLEGGAAGMLTMKGFGSGVTTYKDTLAAFNGDAIENYSANDRIDVAGLPYSKAVTVSFTPGGAASGTLNIYASGVLEASVHLFGQLAATSFMAQGDGSGGTLILDPPKQPPLALAAGQ